MRFDTKDVENIKCTSTFKEYKEETRSSIYFNKEQEIKRVKRENSEIENLKKQIEKIKLGIKDIKSRSKNRRKILRLNLNQEGYEKAVEEGLIEMKKFVEEHPDFCNKGDGE